MMRFGWGHHHLNVQDCVFYSTNHVLGLFEWVDHVLFFSPGSRFCINKPTQSFEKNITRDAGSLTFQSILSCQCILWSWDEIALLQTNVTLNGLGRCVHTCRSSCHTFKVRELLQLDKTMYIDVHDIHRCSYWCTHGCVRKLYRDAVCYSKLLVNSRPYSPNRIPYQPPNNTHLENLNQP